MKLNIGRHLEYGLIGEVRGPDPEDTDRLIVKFEGSIGNIGCIVNCLLAELSRSEPELRELLASLSLGPASTADDVLDSLRTKGVRTVATLAALDAATIQAIAPALITPDAAEKVEAAAKAKEVLKAAAALAAARTIASLKIAIAAAKEAMVPPAQISVAEAKDVALLSLRDASTIEGLRAALATASFVGLDGQWSEVSCALERLCDLLVTALEGESTGELSAALAVAESDDVAPFATDALKRAVKAIYDRRAEEAAEAGRRLERLAVGLPEELTMPREYSCPISQEPMIDPVATADGFSYERANIERWLRDNKTSPKTGKQLSSKRLVPNTTLKIAIADFPKAQHDILMSLIAQKMREDQQALAQIRASQEEEEQVKKQLMKLGLGAYLS